MILFELFKEMKKDPSRLLNPTFRDLETFVYGVIYYWEMHNLLETDDLILFKNFKKWVPIHFQMNPQLGWARPIWFHARDDVHALRVFFELWESFLSNNHVSEKGKLQIPKPPDKIIDIPDFLIYLKQRPPQYLGDATFQNLVNYLNGIVYCRAYLKWPTPKAEERFKRFTQWVPLWFRVSGDHSWYRICLLYQSGSVHGLDEFFELWDDFNDLMDKMEKAKTFPENEDIVKQAAWACNDFKYSEGLDLFENLLGKELSPVEHCQVLLKRAQLCKQLGNDEQAKQDMLEAAAIYHEKADQSKQWWELKILIDFDPE